MDSMKKIILLVLPVILLAGCSVKEKEKEITVFRSTVSSVYTGKVRRNIPDGEGTARMENGAGVEGIFENGILISGEAADVPYSITYNDLPVSGVYSGEVSGQLPSGTGSFTADGFCYSGTWAAGVPEGPGTVEAEHFRIDTPFEVLEGSYSGEFRNGQAEGSGTFIYQSDGDEVQMEGSFAGNSFDGLLVKTVRYQDTVKSYPVYYQKGWPLKTAAAMIAYLEGMRNESYCLSEAQMSFISDHSDLFDNSQTGQNLLEEYSSTFDYAAFSEDSEPALIMIRNAEIRSLQRYKPYSGADTVTTMIVRNNDGWYHLVFARSVEDVSRGDVVNICALPLCRSTLTAPEQDYPAVDAAGAAVIIP